MIKTSKDREYWPLDKKCTAMFGNVQLGVYDTRDYSVIRSRFDLFFKGQKEVYSYFFILHDDSDNLHVHFAVLLSVQERPITFLNKICDNLHVSEQAVSITRLKSVVGALKYFLHITDESKDDGKKEYQIYELLSNESDLVIKGYLESESDNDISINLIRDLVISCDLKSDVILRINNDRIVKRMRYYIDTFWQDKPMLQLRQDKFKDDLPW